MNTREQALRKQVERLRSQVAVLSMTLDRLIADLEMTESVGCAFAWDASLRGLDEAITSFEEAINEQ